MDDAFWSCLLDKSSNLLTLREIHLVEREVFAFTQNAEAIVLQLLRVVGVDVVEPNDRNTVVKQPLGCVKTNKAGTARYENGF